MKYINLLLFIFGLSSTFFIQGAQCHGSGVSGDEIDPNQIKYQVSIRGNNQHKCGGGIIDDRHVITAARCVIDENGKFTKQSLKVVHKSGVQVAVERMSVPREFNFARLTTAGEFHPMRDIAILKLKSGLGLGSNPNLSNLEFPQEPYLTYADDPAVVAVNADSNLQFAHVQVLGNRECNRIYPNSIHRTNLCAQVIQTRNKPKGTCQGDIGSPLVYNGNIVIGVLFDNAPGCNENALPAIYTRITSNVFNLNLALKDRDTANLLIGTSS